MNKEKEFLLWFEQMERGDVAIVGGKSSSLGEMTSKTMYLYRMVLQLLHMLIDILLKRAA